MPKRMVAAKSSGPGRDESASGAPSFVEALIERILNPLGLVVLSKERIQETLEEAVERGRITRSDANELVLELVRRGRQQTDELLCEIERVLGLGRQQLDAATRVARRTVGMAPSPPIEGYDEMTAARIQERLGRLSPAELRALRDYERRHANRKSVLGAIDRALA